MKRAPVRLLESASLSPLERRVLEAGRAARFDFDSVAGAERLRQAIHAGGPALANSTVLSTSAATSFKFACVLASAAGLGAAYYGFSARSPAAPPFEAPDVLAPQGSIESDTTLSEPRPSVAAGGSSLAPTQPSVAPGERSAPGSVTASRKRRARARSNELTVASPEVIEAAGHADSPSEPAASRPAATSSGQAVTHDSSAPGVMTELREVVRARMLLRRDPGQALVILEQLRATHPRGFLMEERAALSVLALASAGQRDLAERRAAEFLRRNPESPFADRVRRAVER